MFKLNREAILKSAKDDISQLNSDLQHKLILSKKHIEKSLSDIQPTGLNDIIMEIPKVKLDFILFKFLESNINKKKGLLE